LAPRADFWLWLNGLKLKTAAISLNTKEGEESHFHYHKPPQTLMIAGFGDIYFWCTKWPFRAAGIFLDTGFRHLLALNGHNFGINAHVAASPSDIDLVLTPQLFYTYLYNQAHRLRLEKLLHLELSREVPTEFLNHFWIQVAVSFLKPPQTAVT
jgi:hypothetical protein